jgi:integrase
MFSATISGRFLRVFGPANAAEWIEGCRAALQPHARASQRPHEDLQQQDIICPYVFHRPSGKQIKDFRALRKSACERAGYPGNLFHDFRRSAVRTLERSGVPRSTAMAMVGHKTESIYRRYAIVDEQMHREAAAKLDVWASDQRVRADAERKGQLQRFAKRALKNS